MWRRLTIIFFSVLALILVTSTPVAAQFWPVTSGRVSSRDGKWLTPLAGGLLSSDEQDHLGRGSVFAWDISVPLGTTVYPMAAGRVSYAGCNNAGGYGCWILVDHQDGYLSLYAHMLDEGGGQVLVQTGAKVTPWTPLGRVGWTGMTSFGPHVHWEIHHVEKGRQRLDAIFSRSIFQYCKLCAADPNAIQDATVVAFYTGGALNREVIAGVLLLFCALLFFFRPEVVVVGLHRVGSMVYSIFHTSQRAWQHLHHRNALRWVSLLLVFWAPTFLCGTGTAVAVWMADEEMSPRTLWSYVRYGLYPFVGAGYQTGAHYAAVWGIPCHGVGTLGQACQPHDLVAKAVDWQRDVATFTRTTPVPVVIPRLGGRFGTEEVRRLLNEMHYVDGLVVIDVGVDFQKAHEIVEQLTSFGLDGIAIDMEFTDQVRRRDIYWLAEAFARKRQEANLPGKGVLVLWNVFHNLDQGTDLTVDGIQVIPIFTGYGSVSSKVVGLTATQKLFGAAPLDSGMMAFDQRWPINEKCQLFNTKVGFDCQDWRTLFREPAIQATGWWVQQ
ncbi:MAG: M23 family metallopeptidase [Caldilineaceae bacterium]|nr:M23 family metallopeptidase [Caldilineaceae bacterium]